MGEILLLVHADDRPRLEEETLRLAKALLANPDGSVATHIRRISVVRVALGKGRDPVFTLKHAIESLGHAAAEGGASRSSPR